MNLIASYRKHIALYVLVSFFGFICMAGFPANLQASAVITADQEFDSETFYTIYLKDGRQITGLIMYQDDDIIKVITEEQGAIEINKKTIEEIAVAGPGEGNSEKKLKKQTSKKVYQDEDEEEYQPKKKKVTKKSYESDEDEGYSPKKKKKFPIIIVLGVAAVAVVAIVLLTKKKSNDIRGTWNAQIDLTGGNTWGQETFIFSGSKESGTFVDSEGYSGTYTVTNEKDVYFKYNDYLDTFTGTFNSATTMSGSMTAGNSYSGTWSATKSTSSSAANLLKKNLKNSLNSNMAGKRARKG